MNLIVTDQATADVTRSSRHYDTKPGKYGAEFEDEVEDAITRIGRIRDFTRASRMESPAWRFASISSHGSSNESSTS
jgi:hypothetical protein